MVIFAIMMTSYNQTSSVGALSWIYFATSIPALFIAVPVGILIDRFSKKINLLASDLMIALAIAILFFADKSFAVMFFMVLLIQIGISYQNLCNQALIAHFFAKDELHTINGLLQFKKGFQKLVAPALGGYLYSVTSFNNILLLHSVSICCALLCVAWIKIPPLKSSHKTKRPFDLTAGFKYIFSEKDLRSLAVLFFQINFLSGIFSVVYTPILLEFADEKALGLALSMGSLGMILGSFLSFRLKNVDKYTFLLFLITANGFFEIIISYKSFIAFSLGLFLSSICSSFIAITNGVMWQSLVPAELSGRVFGARDLIAQSSLPLGMLLGGFLGDVAKIGPGLWIVLLITGFSQIGIGAFYHLAQRKRPEELVP